MSDAARDGDFQVLRDCAHLQLPASVDYKCRIDRLKETATEMVMFCSIHETLHSGGAPGRIIESSSSSTLQDD